MSDQALVTATVGKAQARGGAAPLVWSEFAHWILVDRLGWISEDDGAGGRMVIYLAAFMIVLVLRVLERRQPAFGWGLLAAGPPSGYESSGAPVEVEGSPRRSGDPRPAQETAPDPPREVEGSPFSVDDVDDPRLGH